MQSNAAPGRQLGAPSPGALQCRLCGATPAVRGAAREHRGLVVLMRSLRLEGPFCRSCGLAVTRRTTAATLSRGWWGPASFLITIGMLLANARLLLVLGVLAEPGPAAPGCRSLDPGVPMLRRPQTAGLAVPLVLLLVVVLLLVALG